VARKKQQGNGSGTVYPRKNKDGKIVGYLGQYFDPEGNRRYVSAKHKGKCREKLRAAMADADKGLVFPTTTGTTVSCTKLLGRHFKPLLERAGLPDIRLHDLRHTCATMLLKMGQHPKYVQELLGHANITITLDTYSHVIEGMGDGLADAMDGAL
jgi:integrase